MAGTIEGARLVTGNALYRRVFDFWILANNSWMQAPVGYAVVDGRITPTDWQQIVLGPVQMVHWPHMLLAAFLTSAMCVAATGACLARRLNARLCRGLRLRALLHLPPAARWTWRCPGRRRRHCQPADGLRRHADTATGGHHGRAP